MVRYEHQVLPGMCLPRMSRIYTADIDHPDCLSARPSFDMVVLNLVHSCICDGTGVVYVSIPAQVQRYDTEGMGSLLVCWHSLLRWLVFPLS